MKIYNVPIDGRGLTQHIHWVIRVGKSAAGCLLDGKEHKEMPTVF